MPGSASRSTAVARLTLSAVLPRPDRGTNTPPDGEEANAVPTPASDDSGTGAGAAPLKARKGSSVRSSPGPTPATRSKPASPPNVPCASRSATIVLANRSPTRGSRAISAAGAESTSIRSPGASARACRTVLSRCAASDPGEIVERICTPPVASPGRVARYRTACPATANASNSRSALRSGGCMKEGRMEGGNGGRRFNAAMISFPPPLFPSSPPSAPTAPASPARSPRLPRPAGSPRSPCRWCRPECARLGSRSRPRRSRGCRPSAARGDRRSACAWETR